MSKEPGFHNSKTVLEEGNVAPGQVFKPKAPKFNSAGEEILDSSEEEEIEEEVHNPLELDKDQG